MSGRGLAGRLEAFCPYSIHVAHMYNLIVVEIPTSISTHFNRSPQRRAKLQTKAGLRPPLEILRVVLAFHEGSD